VRRSKVRVRGGTFERSKQPIAFWLSVGPFFFVSAVLLVVLGGFDVGLFLGWWKAAPTPY
jgi:hypothetical protein